MFTGSVSITLEVTKPTSTITLNAVDLVFDRAALDGGPNATSTFDKKLGRATLTLPKPVATGRHILSIAYHGKIGRTTLGFFAMDYTGPNGPRRTLGTNFEPADARDLLPCWDEPGRKATFAVTVDVPKDETAVSNMPVAHVTPLPGGLQRVSFATTPKMSTYLLFLGVGDFERVHKQVDGVDVGIVVKRGDTPKAAYALDEATRLLHYYNDYFGIAFPLPKLDLIAAPGELNGGSMENWGAIFYSQDHLLFDPKSSTERDRQLVFIVVAHEMAHQWFGDLVTMSWWDNLWLNEGFARWMQTYAADDLHPEWETGLQAARVYESGKEADSVPSTHPVLQQVDTADQAMQSFDDITYDKGAAIITMINAYVGRDKFREGVRRYMRAHAFGNTEDADLWKPMQEVAQLPITQIEQDFTRQVGLPLVHVTASAKGLSLLTTRFATDPAALQSASPQHWHLPLAIASVPGASRYVLLADSAQDAARPPALVNAGQLGYARVLYDDADFQALASKVADLQPADQLGLLNDAWALALSVQTPGPRILEISKRLPVGANPIVWDRVLTLLTEIDRHYERGPQRDAFRHFALGVLAPVLQRVGHQSAVKESANASILRDSLLQAAGRFGEADVLADARKRVRDGTGSASERRTALEIVARAADPATFDRLLTRAQQTTDPLEKNHLLSALADVEDPALARRMVAVALGNQVPAGSNGGLLAEIAVGHPDLTWDLVAPHFDDPKLPLSKNERWDLVSALARSSSLPRRVNDLQAYVAHSIPVESRKPFLRPRAIIQQNERLTKNVLPELDRWIQR
jgi:aminopeptidase N